MLVLIPIPSSALFLEKSLSLLVVSPSPAEGGNPRTLLFCTRRLQFHSHFCVSSFQLFPPIPSPHPGCCLLAPLATLPWCQHCPPLFAGIMGILWYEKWYKNQIQTFPQLSLQCSPTSTYPRPTWRVIEKLEAYWGSSTAAKCKSQVLSVDSHREGRLYDFKPPPIHPTLLLQSLIWLLAEQLLNCCMLQLCMLGKNQIQCQFSTVQQTVKLAASSTAAPQAAKPSLEWGSGIPFSHLPSS